MGNKWNYGGIKARNHNNLTCTGSIERRKRWIKEKPTRIYQISEKGNNAELFLNFKEYRKREKGNEQVG